MKQNRLITFVFIIALAFNFGSVFAQAETATPSPLDLLLEEVRQSVINEGKLNKEREQKFIRERNKQRDLLAQAKRELAAENSRSDRLKKAYDDNEKELADLETVLRERQGNLGEMFGVVRQVAADVKSQFENSMVSAQIPGRIPALADLAQRKELATVPELRKLWFEMQREITEGGRIVTFNTSVQDGSSLLQNQSVTRIGVFNAIFDGKFLLWETPSGGEEDGQLEVLYPQPAKRFRDMASDLEQARNNESVMMAVDPTRGAILSLVVQTPSLEERIKQGKEVGYVIIVIGLFGLLLCLYRGLMLFTKGAAIKSQLKKDEASQGNALGRVMKVYEDNPGIDVETLELKLDEAILRETAPLEAGLSFIKILYIVAPLLGLLGTVTGMIETFQQITLFGTGDPRMMAGGISTALVTTVLGLVVAIPLTVLHSMLSGRSKSLIHILEEQSAGIIAKLAEKK